MTGPQNDNILGEHLKALRLGAGLELSALARRVNLSPAQLSQLEAGEESLFYTRAIRLQAARKVILHLGGDLAPWLGLEPPSSSASQSSVRTASGPGLDIKPRDASVVRPAPAAAMGSPASATASARKRVAAGGVALAGLLFGLAYLVGDSREPPVLGASVRPEAANAKPTEPAAVSPSNAGVSTAESPSPQDAATAVPLQQVASSAPDAEPAPAATGAQAEPSACTAPSDAAPSVQPPQASKPGDMVYVVSRVVQVVCVTDASGTPRLQQFKPGQAQSFYGQPPWHVQAGDLRQTQLYFQGWKVRLPAQAQDQLRLLEFR